MAKKVIITESMAKRIMLEGMLQEGIVDDVLKSHDFETKVKKIVKDTQKSDKEIEKMVKDIIVKSLNKFFKTLWQRNAFYANEI